MVWGGILTATGEIERGWQEHQWLYHPETETPAVAKFGGVLPQWDGSDPQGRTLLVYADQGVGDAIQYLRFVPILARRVNARVVVWVPGALGHLFETIPGVDEWRSSEDFTKASAGCWAIVPMGGIPARLGLTHTDATEMCPALDLPAARVADWKTWLGARKQSRLAVGLVWQGNIEHSHDIFRSIPRAYLAPLFDVAGVTWVSLQIPDARRSATETRLPFEAVDAAPRLRDWIETAAALRSLDVLITVDTGVAHLAGTLGVPTWLMLAHIPDPRWMLAGESTPWYPSIRLFRQPAVGDWGTVIERVRTEIQALVPGDALGLSAHLCGSK